MSIDWSKAPEGATHCLIKDSGTAWFRFKDDNSFPNTWKDGEWKNVRLPTRELTPKPKQPKRLTQAVFDGLPPEYRWAAVDADGSVHCFHEPPIPTNSGEWIYNKYLICEDWHDVATDWQNSLIERQESITDVARSIEAARQVEKDAVNNPSHYTTGGIECIDAMQAMLSRDEFIGYLRGNVFKYQWRYQHKNGVEDLKKARWYANRLIELEQSK